MSKVLTLDVTLAFQSGEKTRTHIVSGVSAQEAFNILHMPSMSEHVVALVPNWVESDVPPVSEPANKE